MQKFKMQNANTEPSKRELLFAFFILHFALGFARAE
jgi:hypothetical protein